MKRIMAVLAMIATMFVAGCVSGKGQVNEILERFFGITLSEAQAEEYNIGEHNCYRNGVFCLSLDIGE